MAGKVGQISGLLNIDKPAGLTSHDVVARIRKLAGQKKVGHAGTLDPLATGVLLVCLGQATRLIEYVTAGRKQYRATIHFGLTTDTLDADGQVVARRDAAHLTETELRQVLAAFQGEIEQIPPIFSALKQGGQPLYKLARAGQTVDVAPRRVTIYSLNWLEWQPPLLTIDLTCSPGTYVRSLARDLGEAVGAGAHLAKLTRLASGAWTLAEAVPLAVLEQTAASDPAGWQKCLWPLDRAVNHLPEVTLAEAAVHQVKQGQQVELALARPIPGELVRAYTPAGEFLAILTRVEAGDTLWQPKKVFHLLSNEAAGA
jgi:tRNA pseudouridine55 synthase